MSAPLIDALNRLGGRSDGPAAEMDLLRRTPPHLPLVVATTGAFSLRAVNVATVMAERTGEEDAVVDALAKVLRTGRHDGDGVIWATRDGKGVARQLVQFALDRPELELGPAVFLAVRALLD